MKKQYLLQDGTYADPSDCKADAAGLLRHKNGLMVSMSEDGTPMELTKDAVTHMNVEAAKMGESELSPPDPAPAPIQKPKSGAKAD